MTCPECGDRPHPEGARFYVTARRDDGEYRALVGPFTTHAEALARVDEATRIAWDLDPRAPWYSYGTAALDFNRPGLLNERLGLTITEEAHGN